MLKLYVLGHTYATLDGRPVRLSTKSLALLTYLALEGRPQHRDHMADLLWDSAGALRNLRVELSRLRQRGLDLFPPAQPMLELSVRTDLDDWLASDGDVGEAQLSTWLAVASTPALGGLDDVGTLAFRAWLDARRALIGQVIEEHLVSVRARLLERGGPRIRMIEAQMQRLEIPVAPLVAPPAPAPSALMFERPEVQARLLDALGRAGTAPHLILVEERAGSDVRDLMAEVAVRAGWQLLEVKASSDAELIASVLERQLSGLEPVGDAPSDPATSTRTEGVGRSLRRSWARLVARGLKLAVAIQVDSWLSEATVESVHYAMGLPGPLAIVLYGAGSVDQFHQHDLAAIDQRRVIRLPIPPLGVGEILAVLNRVERTLDPEQRLARATMIAQESEGWELFARSLISQPSDLTGPVSLPGEIREALLADVASLGPALRSALAKLATVHSPFDLDIARLLVGEDAAGVLDEAERRGLLVTAAAQEVVTMPLLRYQSSDQDDQLTLASEPLRAALSGTLTSTERRALRTKLAMFHLNTRPDAGLALYYAQRSARPDLAEAAQGLLAKTPPGQRMARPMVGTPSGHQAHPRLTDVQRLERRTGNGYRVVLEGGQLQVLRYGVHTRAPLLRLRWSSVPAGEWQFVGRIDVFREAPELGRTTSAFAVGVQFPDAPLAMYSTEAIWVAPDRADRPAGGQVPLGRWFRLSGRSEGGAVELQVRGLDVALTVALWHSGGQTLIPVPGLPGTAGSGVR